MRSPIELTSPRQVEILWDTSHFPVVGALSIYLQFYSSVISNCKSVTEVSKEQFVFCDFFIVKRKGTKLVGYLLGCCTLTIKSFAILISTCWHIYNSFSIQTPLG
jgi:hypothetical protein